MLKHPPPQKIAQYGSVMVEKDGDKKERPKLAMLRKLACGKIMMNNMGKWTNFMGRGGICRASYQTTVRYGTALYGFTASPPNARPHALMRTVP